MGLFRLGLFRFVCHGVSKVAGQTDATNLEAAFGHFSRLTRRSLESKNKSCLLAYGSKAIATSYYCRG